MLTNPRRLWPPSPVFADRLLLALVVTILKLAPCARAAADLAKPGAPPDPALEPETASPNASLPPSEQTGLFIREYRVQGAKRLPRLEVEKAVYPFLGPARTPEDVEQARAALEKAYKDKGFQAVAVQVPVQQARNGVVILRVSEGTVGRLRVTGSNYSSLEKIKRSAPSLAQGEVVNFNAVTKDIVALNQLPDRQVTPALRPGLEPGTVDIDLAVKDKLPLHGSLELNNRYSADTTQLRLNGSLSYGNLWQLGHTIGLSFQISPLDLSEVKVFSGYYLVRFADLSWLTLLLQGTNQDSNVSTLGGIGVAGKGQVIGARAIVALPLGKNFYHSLAFGVDYKHFNQDILQGHATLETPITYYPFSLAYNATWAGKTGTTEFNATIVYHPRGLGSDEAEFDFNRFKAGGSFFYLRSDLAHTHELSGGMQLFAKVQGQVADQPLVNSEQFSGGGLATVRGYLEAEVLGDNAVFGSLELRSPSFLSHGQGHGDEWRIYAFADGGVATLNEPLPEQHSTFTLASVGVGGRLRVWQHLNGSLDLGVPLVSQVETDAFDVLLTFRLWGDF